MDRIIDIIEGLWNGDPKVIAIVIFAVVGTAVIYAVTQVIQARRKREGKK